MFANIFPNTSLDCWCVQGSWCRLMSSSTGERRPGWAPRWTWRSVPVASWSSSSPSQRTLATCRPCQCPSVLSWLRWPRTPWMRCGSRRSMIRPTRSLACSTSWTSLVGGVAYISCITVVSFACTLPDLLADLYELLSVFHVNYTRLKQAAINRT